MNSGTQAHRGIRNAVIEGDCLAVLPTIPTGSVDMVLADLPYGTTRNKWDNVIDLEALWREYWRVLKPNGAAVLFAQTPFNVVLGASCIDYLRYEWVWDKTRGTGHLNANRCPLKSHENVLVFYKALPTYHPQMSPGAAYISKAGRGSTNSTNYNGHGSIEVAREGRLPTTILPFKRDTPRIHPTQKPVALFEYLIRTYTDSGELVLDNVAGSGTTAIAALRANRDYLCIEKDSEYVALIRRRIGDFTAAQPREVACAV